MTPEHFVEAVAVPMLPGVHNPWAQVCPTEVDMLGAEARKDRLRKHLQCDNPARIIVGNAGRFQEARLSGIPFTTEKLILEGMIPRVSLPKGQRISKLFEPMADEVAESVWHLLHQAGIAHRTILCNAVPWHPEGKKGAASNRKPSRREIELGRLYLSSILQMHPDTPVIAIGETADRVLNELNVEHHASEDPELVEIEAFRRSLLQLLS